MNLKGLSATVFLNYWCFLVRRDVEHIAGFDGNFLAVTPDRSRAIHHENLVFKGMIVQRGMAAGRHFKNPHGKIRRTVAH